MAEKVPLGPDNVILRGSCLRNTESVMGIVVYAGKDTKIMKNSAQAKYKFSRLELIANVCILVVLGVQIFLSAVGGIIGTMWVTENGN